MIRPPGPEDIAPVAALWHAAWHDAHAAIAPPELVAARTPDIFRARLPPLLARLRVWADPAPSGFVAWAADGELGQLFVARAARGLGIGAALLAAGEAALRAEGHGDAHLFCAFRNDTARRFYLAHDWRDPGLTSRVLPFHAGAFASMLIHRMTKRLA